MKMPQLIAGCVALSVLSASAAHAISTFTCAEVVTHDVLSDGHAPILAPIYLRVKPGGKIRGKIYGGSILYLTEDRSLQLFKDWKLVEGMEGDEAGDTYGWVATKYLKPVKCPPPQPSEDK